MILREMMISKLRTMLPNKRSKVEKTNEKELLFFYNVFLEEELCKT